MDINSAVIDCICSIRAHRYCNRTHGRSPVIHVRMDPIVIRFILIEVYRTIILSAVSKLANMRIHIQWLCVRGAIDRILLSLTNVFSIHLFSYLKRPKEIPQPTKNRDTSPTRRTTAAEPSSSSSTSNRIVIAVRSEGCRKKKPFPEI